MVESPGPIIGFALTAEQLDLIRLVESGHNICIIGKAGIGKSTVVNEIWRVLMLKGKRCHVVCYSGVASKLYGGLAKTIHPQYSLQTTEVPSHVLLEKALGRKNV